MRSVIILFAKAPVPGRVKTRLLPVLSADEAAALHTTFVADMIERLQQVPGTHFELHTDIPSDAWAEFSVTRKLQIPGDLGLKMLHSLASAFASGYDRATIMGSDSPNLPVDHVQRLITSEADIALGPTEDGGYYAISAKRTHSAMFEGVAWSTPATLSGTERALANCGLTMELGEIWFDVDEPADLQRLQACTDLPRRTRAFLQHLAAGAHPTK